MAHLTADRVKETTTTAGTGAITLAGAVVGFRAFSSVLAIGDTCYYSVASLPGAEWEVGIGTYSALNTLTRTTVLSSSNAGAAVTFSAGTKEIFITAAASRFLQEDAAGNVGLGTDLPQKLLHLSSTTNGATIRIQADQGGAISGDIQNAIEFYNNDATIGTQRSTAAIKTINTDGTFGRYGRLGLFTASGVLTEEERLTIDNAGNSGFGITTPTSYGAGYTTLAVNNTTAGVLDLMAGSVSQFRLFGNASENRLQGVTNVPMTFFTNNTERMRVDTTGNLLPSVTNSTTLGSSSFIWSSNYANKFISSNSSAQSLTDGAAIFNGGSGAILLDDSGHKRISWNDGGGNFNIRVGNYYNATSAATVYAKGSGDSNGGAANITIASDNVDGSILLSVAAIGVPGATVGYSKTLNLTTTGMSYDGTITGTSFNSITGLSSTTPVVAGTAAVGTGTTAARGDHVHPAQTTVTTATNIAAGAAGSIPYQTAAGATSLLATGTGVLVGGATPSYTTTPTLTGTNFTGIPNAGLTNSSVTIGSTAVSLGSTVTTFAGLTSVTSTAFVGALTGNASGSAATFTSTTQNSQFNSIGVGVAASTTAGQINAGNIISSGIVTGTGGIKSSDTSFPTYQILLDFGADLTGTWRKIITATLSAGTQYSTHGFKIRITDPNANHATQGSVNVDEVVYYVACVRSESTVVDTPDLCVVRGPAQHVRAVKLATGSYEIQVQPEAQYREYLITIESYATNGAHTIVYSNGSAAGSAGTATYSAAVGGATTWVDKLQSTGTITGTQLISNIATGTAPLTVASTTLVTNLNADLLDGLNSATANTVSTIVARDASGNFSAGTITAALTGTASTATNIAGGAAGSIPYQTAAGATSLLATGTGVLVGGTTPSYTTTPTLTGTNFTGIPNGGLTNSSVTIGSTSVSLGGTITAISGLGVVAGTSFNLITGLSSTTPVVAGTAAVGTGTTAARGDHVHPAQTTVSGNANTATTLATARTINGTSFNGSANISVPRIPSSGNLSAETLRSVNDTGIYTFNTNNASLGDSTPVNYWSTLAWGNGANGSAELAVNWTSSGNEIWFRSLRDTVDNWYTWKEILHSSNYNSYSPTLTGTGASGTWGISITGNADTVDTLHASSFLRSDASTTFSGGVLTVTTPAGSLGSNTGSVNTLQIYQATLNTDAFQTFHIASDHAVHFGLDGTTNDLFVGGWSAGAVKNKIWHAGNDGSGSGLDADLLDGLELHTARNNEANKVVRSDANGYIQAGWINTTSGDNGTTAIDRVYASSDGYIRYYTPANFRTVLDVPTRTGGSASGSWGISVTGSSASCTGNAATATTATNQSGGTVSGTSVEGSYLGVNNTSSTNGYGLSLYNGATAGQPTYGIMFQGTATFGTHGSVTADWATYFTMNNTANRGWVFRNMTTPTNVASINNSGTAVFNGNVTAYSDIRLKKDVEVITDAVSKVKELRGVTYTRTDDENLGRQTGVIAQEVLKVLPEAVMGSEDSTYSVAYGNMVGLLIEAIKEQQNTIDSQEERINRLEEMLNKLIKE